METIRTFTAQEWKRHEEFVKMLRTVKERKRQRQAQLEKELAAEEEYASKRRAEVDALFGD